MHTLVGGFAKHEMYGMSLVRQMIDPRFTGGTGSRKGGRVPRRGRDVGGRGRTTRRADVENLDAGYEGPCISCRKLFSHRKREKERERKNTTICVRACGAVLHGLQEYAVARVVWCEA